MPRHSRLMSASLFIRNCPEDARSEELREVFGKYGPVTDVYIPLDYYTRQHRGFAYIQFEDQRDADDALYCLNGFRYCGVELEIEMARSDRKTPYMMRARERGGKYDDSNDYDYRGRSGRDRRRSYSRSPRRRRSRSRSRSVSDRRDSRRRHSPPRRDRSSSASSREHRN